MDFELVEVIKSKDRMTRKFRFLLDEKYVTEFVLVERPEKNIICFPSQLGCSLSCKFCRSGNYVRDLTANEIFLGINSVKLYITHNKPTLLSCMGEGEPALNKNFHEILTMLNTSPDRLALATTGIRPSIFEEMNEFKDNLKIMLSLHASSTSKRFKLLQNKMDVEFLMEEFNKYQGKKEVNYVLINDFNDSIKDCRRLKKLCKKLPVKINRYNKTTEYFEASQRVKKFMFMYKMLGGKIEYYETDGTDIRAACGMMSYQIR